VTRSHGRGGPPPSAKVTAPATNTATKLVVNLASGTAIATSRSTPARRRSTHATAGSPSPAAGVIAVKKLLAAAASMAAPTGTRAPNPRATSHTRTASTAVGASASTPASTSHPGGTAARRDAAADSSARLGTAHHAPTTTSAITAAPISSVVGRLIDARLMQGDRDPA
jgi:hypothetical protein